MINVEEKYNFLEVNMNFKLFWHMFVEEILNFM